MTASDDFMPSGDPGFDSGPSYPVIFGISFTPLISGILLGLAGVAAAAYLVTSFVLPEWEKYGKLQQEVQQKQAELAQGKTVVQDIKKAEADLETAKKQRAEVLTLFGNDSTLDTLLLDINQQIKSRTPADIRKETEKKLANCPAFFKTYLPEIEKEIGPLVLKSELDKFVPDYTKSGVIADDSYGVLVANKLKRQIVNVEFIANFEQTRLILQRIERLQPLLALKNVSFAVGTESGKPFKDFYLIKDNTIELVKGCQPEPPIKTTVRLEVLLPLNPEESKRISDAAKQQQQQQPQQQQKK